MKGEVSVWKEVPVSLRARQTPKHTHDQYYLVIVIKMLVLGLQEGRKRSFLFLPRPRTNILYTIRKNLLLGGSGASLLPPNKDSSFTCITRVNRSLVGRSEAPLPTKRSLSPGNYSYFRCLVLRLGNVLARARTN